jgi:hypothetical protein
LDAKLSLKSEQQFLERGSAAHWLKRAEKRAAAKAKGSGKKHTKFDRL